MKRDLKHAREIVSVPQSTAATRAVGIHKRHLFVVDFLEQQMQMQNEKELIRLCLASAKGGAILYFCGGEY